MNTDQPKELSSSYCQTVALAVLRLKQQLQLEHERKHPELREIIPAILDQEETNAWNLSLFPHLLLPDLVEGRIAKLHFDAAKNQPYAPRLASLKSRTRVVSYFRRFLRS
jgi:hypothetical protein